MENSTSSREGEDSLSAEKERMRHFFPFPRTPKMNAFAERCSRTLQEEATFLLFSEPTEVWNHFLSHDLMQYNFFRLPLLCWNTKLEVFLKRREKGEDVVGGDK